MIDPQKVSEKIIELLKNSDVEYKEFSHRIVLSYEDAAEAQKETGFFGTESKCMVMKADDTYFVYITLQGKRVNMNAIKEKFAAKKVRLVTKEELKDLFGAEPGCAYPFGFEEKYPIFIDPKIFEQEWLLFSPAVPTKTIQAKGVDLKKVFEKLPNTIESVENFNE